MREKSAQKLSPITLDRLRKTTAALHQKPMVRKYVFFLGMSTWNRRRVSRAFVLRSAGPVSAGGASRLLLKTERANCNAELLASSDQLLGYRPQGVRALLSAGPLRNSYLFLPITATLRSAGFVARCCCTLARASRF